MVSPDSLLSILVPALLLHVSLAEHWVKLLSFHRQNLTVVASSGNGLSLVAGYNSGPLFFSHDGGLLWTKANSGDGPWGTVASRGDGGVSIAQTLDLTGSMYKSSDYGVTWSALQGTPQAYWTGLSSSFDGNIWFTTGRSASKNVVYSSSDGGLTWSYLTNSPAIPSDDSWVGVACSFDCSVLYTASANGLIFVSRDRGLTWTLINTGLGLSSLGTSSDGSRVVTAVYLGGILLSTNYGVSFSPTQAPSNEWQNLVIASDGSVVFAADSSGDVWKGSLNSPRLTSHRTTTSHGTTISRATKQNVVTQTHECL